MRYYIIALLLVIGVQAGAQEEKAISFAPPFDFPLVLSGNFGEIRSDHFHGGLDFKTGGVSGKKLLALGDGYISRIRVTHGSGYVLEVTYDNGYYTINRHLLGFVSPIAERVEKLQYENESWEVSITPEKDEYPVKAGQHIAYSGNTGYSFGPHLHLDVLETETNDYIDPLPLFKNKIKDTRAPQALGFMIIPQQGKGVVNGKSETHTFQLTDSKIIEAWGEIGFALRAYDYADAANNRLGVHTVILQVDGEEVFRSTVDRFSQYESRMVNSWTEGAFMKSFIDPGSTLRLLKASNENRGLVTINEQRDYLFQYTLKDIYGNTSRYRFVVKGKKQIIEPFSPREKYFFVWDKVNYLKEPGLDLLIPRGRLYDNVALNYSAFADSTSIAYTYHLHDKETPLHAHADLQIGLIRMPVADSTKYYIARINEKGELVSYGGKYENGFIRTRIHNLGTYTVAIDTIAPKVTPVAKEKWARNRKIVFKIEEEQTGIKSYRGTIDGEYALFGLHIMNDLLICELDSDRVKRGVPHTIEITVTDDCKNTTVVKDTFRW